MTTSVTPTVRASALPCRPSGNLATLLFAAACALAACDPGPVDANVDIAPLQPAPQVAARGHAASAAAYFGDEYAEVLGGLTDPSDGPLAPTF